MRLIAQPATLYCARETCRAMIYHSPYGLTQSGALFLARYHHWEKHCGRMPSELCDD
jgi:hypothetical protein